MRKLIYGAACSLDGYLAGPDDEIDWLEWSDDVERISKTSWSTFDTVVMGRRSYEVAVRAGGGAYPGVQNYVFSKTLPPRIEDRLEFVNEDAVPFVERLKQGTGRDICLMGGGILAHCLLGAGLVDEVGLNLHPLLLGSGIPMFPAPWPGVALELVEHEAIAHDCMYLLYRVRRTGAST